MQLRMSFLENVPLLNILEARFGPTLTKKLFGSLQISLQSVRMVIVIGHKFIYCWCLFSVTL